MMRSLTAAFILLASFPSYSCPFHGAFFWGDDDSTPYPKTFIGNKMGENRKSTSEKKPQAFYQFMNFKSQLKQWKDKREQQKQPSSGTSQAPVVESFKLKENLKQK